MQLAGAPSSGVSWILSLPHPSPPGLQGPISLFPFLTGVQNNNYHSGSEGHAETKASRLRRVGPAAGLSGAAGLARSVQQGGRLGCGRPFLRNAETSAWWRGKAAGGQSGGRWRPARVRVLKCSFESLCRRPGPGGRGGVVIIKQHLHRDFVYKALSQGREARGWPAESGLGGRGPCSARPPAPAGSGLCAGRTKRYSFRDFRFPRISSLSLLSCEELAPACHSGRRRGVRGPRGRGPDGRVTGAGMGGGPDPAAPSPPPPAPPAPPPAPPPPPPPTPPPPPH